MKKIVMTALAAVSLGAALLAFRAPEQPIEMKPFSEFNGDTLGYLKYHLSGESRTKFAGRTIGELTQHIEIPIKRISVDHSAARGEDLSEIGAIELYVTTNFKKGAIRIRVSLSERIKDGSPLHKLFDSPAKLANGLPYSPELFNLIKDLKIRYHSAGHIFHTILD